MGLLSGLHEGHDPSCGNRRIGDKCHHGPPLYRGERGDVHGQWRRGAFWRRERADRPERRHHDDIHRGHGRRWNDHEDLHPRRHPPGAGDGVRGCGNWLQSRCRRYGLGHRGAGGWQDYHRGHVPHGGRSGAREFSPASPGRLFGQRLPSPCGRSCFLRGRGAGWQGPHRWFVLQRGWAAAKRSRAAQ